MVCHAGLAPPFIVKPLVACGVADSHQMALVLHEGALQLLQGAVPTPALVQEFVNHGGLQYKAYALGSKVGGALVGSRARAGQGKGGMGDEGLQIEG